LGWVYGERSNITSSVVEETSASAGSVKEKLAEAARVAKDALSRSSTSKVAGAKQEL
jgi:hypothetical protein